MDPLPSSEKVGDTASYEGAGSGGWYDWVSMGSERGHECALTFFFFEGLKHGLTG